MRVSLPYQKYLTVWTFSNGLKYFKIWKRQVAVSQNFSISIDCLWRHDLLFLRRLRIFIRLYSVKWGNKRSIGSKTTSVTATIFRFSYFFWIFVAQTVSTIVFFKTLMIASQQFQNLCINLLFTILSLILFNNFSNLFPTLS